MTGTSEPLRKFPKRTHYRHHIAHLQHHGAKSNSERSNCQIDCRRRSSVSLTACRTGAGKQRCKEHGFLQSMSHKDLYLDPLSQDHPVDNLMSGVQCKNSTLYSGHADTCAHHSPPRSLIPLPASHTTHCDPPPKCGGCTTNQEQDTGCRKRSWTNEQPRRTKGKNVNE